MGRRWIRLDAQWDETGWIDALSGQAAGCWPRLLCWVKLRGRKGRCKLPERSVLARRWRTGRKVVDEMMDAALRDGALRVEGGDLVVANWERYQEPDRTATARKRRQRARERAEADKKDEETEGVSRKSRRDTVARDPRPPTGNAATTAHAPAGERARGGPEADMASDLEEFLAGVDDERERQKLEAHGRMIITGEDRKAWETPEGGTVDEAERPRLFRLALGYHRDGTQRVLRSSVRYAVKLYTEESAASDPKMGPAERKLVLRIERLKDTDLEASFR